MQTVQWDYSGKWDTRKKFRNYIEYICSVTLSLICIKLKDYLRQNVLQQLDRGKEMDTRLGALIIFPRGHLHSFHGKTYLYPFVPFNRDIHIECSKQFKLILYFYVFRQSRSFWAALKLLLNSNMKFKLANTHTIQSMGQGISLKSERKNP